MIEENKEQLNLAFEAMQGFCKAKLKAHKRQSIASEESPNMPDSDKATQRQRFSDISEYLHIHREIKRISEEVNPTSYVPYEEGQ